MYNFWFSFMDNYQSVIDYLKQNGPSHPVQVGKAIEADIFMSSAILQEMINDKRIKKTSKKVGGSPLYYLSNQEETAKRMVEDSLNLVEKKVLRIIKESGFVFQDELDAQSRFVMQDLKDLIQALKAKIGGEERIIWKYYSVDNNKIERRILSTKPKQLPKKVEPEKIEPGKVDYGVDSSKKYNSAEEVIDKLGAKIIKKEKIKIGEVNYVIEMSSLPNQKYFLKYKKKKRLSDSDLSLVYTEGMAKKMPIMLVTDGSITKKGLEKKKEFGDLFSVLKI